MRLSTCGPCGGASQALMDPSCWQALQISSLGTFGPPGSGADDRPWLFEDVAESRLRTPRCTCAQHAFWSPAVMHCRIWLQFPNAGSIAAAASQHLAGHCMLAHADFEACGWPRRPCASGRARAVDYMWSGRRTREQLGRCIVGLAACSRIVSLRCLRSQRHRCPTACTAGLVRSGDAWRAWPRL